MVLDRGGQGGRVNAREKKVLFIFIVYFENQASISRWPPVASEAHASVDDDSTAGCTTPKKTLVPVTYPSRFDSFSSSKVKCEMTASTPTTAKISGRALCAMVVASNSGENGWRQREPSQGGARRSPPKGFDLRRLRCNPKADVDSALRSPFEEKEKTTTQQRRDALRTQQRRESGRVSLGGVDRHAALRLPRGGAGYSMHNRRRLYGS